jgi:hypothetical protein
MIAQVTFTFTAMALFASGLSPLSGGFLASSSQASSRSTFGGRKMPRRAAKVDRNQPEIVKALRGAGATVQHLHTVGKGCPDILVGYQGVNYLMEIKDGALPPPARKLTDDEEAWHRQWFGNAHIVNNADEALFVIGCGFREIEVRGVVR